MTQEPRSSQCKIKLLTLLSATEIVNEMKMTLDDAAGLNLVSAYADGQAKIRGQEYNTSLLIFPRTLITDWDVETIDGLTPKAFKPIIAEKPELLILGTGNTQVFPHPRTFITLIDRNIGYEVMDNAAACRTYNILLGEGRHAALGLLMSLT
jgi:uncharacterized protein